MSFPAVRHRWNDGEYPGERGRGIPGSALVSSAGEGVPAFAEFSSSLNLNRRLATSVGGSRSPSAMGTSNAGSATFPRRDASGVFVVMPLEISIHQRAI